MKIDNSVNLQSAQKSSEVTISSSEAMIGNGSNKHEDFEFEVSESLLNNSIQKANTELIKSDRMIERSVHEKTGTIMYKVIDTKTKEVIKEFPPEKIQDMIAKMWELAGLFVDEQA